MTSSPIWRRRILPSGFLLALDHPTLSQHLVRRGPLNHATTLLCAIAASVRKALETTLEVNHSGEKKVVKVRENTDCWLAEPGQSGVYISEPLIEAMVGYPSDAQEMPQPKRRERKAVHLALEEAA